MHTNEGKVATKHAAFRARNGTSRVRSGTESIVDLLLSLPKEAESHDAVDRAIVNRHQAEVAHRMRSLIDDDSDEETV